MSSTGLTRVEKDTMGEMVVPLDAYYAAQTARALENFKVSGLTFQRGFIRAMGLIKAGAAAANMELGLLDKEKGEAILAAAMEVAEGKLDREFVVDVFQTGSGTSTNMNTNEVIANRALEILGAKRGDKSVIHPNDHVNMGQSTNDVFPTAIHVSSAEGLFKKLIPSLEVLAKRLEEKSEEFKDIVKSGRTHLQDAVPVTLGQEFGGYAEMIRKGVERARRAAESILELPIGGTATGTGLNAHPELSERIIRFLSEKTGLGFRAARNRFESMGGKDACVEVSGALRVIAGSILKISNDLRLLSSGPVTGFAEIELPAVQPGSSIMPGKVNPVIVESTMLAACRVIGNDVSIFEASRLGELELNMGMPLIAYCLLESIDILSNAARNLAERCIAGIRADAERCMHYAEASPATVTAIAPLIGYDKAALVAKKALAERKTIKGVLIELGITTPERVHEVFDVRRMAEGGIVTRKNA